ESTLAPNIDHHDAVTLPRAANDAPHDEPLIAEDLTFAEAPFEALASDLIPAVVGEAAEKGANERSPIQPAGEAKPAVPLWEVDRFQWPRTCEKLFADDQSYLAQAGDKLLAAMQDGLKVLAVTGSRRGE